VGTCQFSTYLKTRLLTVGRSFAEIRGAVSEVEVAVDRLTASKVELLKRWPVCGGQWMGSGFAGRGGEAVS